MCVPQLDDGSCSLAALSLGWKEISPKPPDFTRKCNCRFLRLNPRGASPTGKHRGRKAEALTRLGYGIKSASWGDTEDTGVSGELRGCRPGPLRLWIPNNPEQRSRDGLGRWLGHQRPDLQHPWTKPGMLAQVGNPSPGDFLSLNGSLELTGQQPSPSVSSKFIEVLCLKKYDGGLEMVQWLEHWLLLPEDLSSMESTQMAAHNGL